MEETEILEFYSDEHVEIRKFIEPICGPSDDPITRYLDDLKAHGNVFLTAQKARKELIYMRILYENGMLSDRELSADMQPEQI